MSRLKVVGRGLRIQWFGGFDSFRMGWRELVDIEGKMHYYEKDKLTICLPRNSFHTSKAKADQAKPSP